MNVDVVLVGSGLGAEGGEKVGSEENFTQVARSVGAEQERQ